MKERTENMTDIEIAQAAKPKNIMEIARCAGIDEKYVEFYGNVKAKIDLSLLSDSKEKADGKLVLVTAITPTPAGEGKTTTTIGLADGLKRLGKKVTVALREPSLGPVFGVKGGAAGAGFTVALTGEIMTMPGLPKVPAAEKIDVGENGKISGSF